MSLVDLILPKFCLGCNQPGSYICRKCRNKLRPVTRNLCLYCSKSSHLGLTHPKCLTKLTIDGNLTIFHYDGFFKRIIKAFKYRLATEVFRELTLNINRQHMEKLIEFKKVLGEAYIQPIPLYENKEKSRGFNQAKMAAIFFKKFLGLPIVDLIYRKKNTLSQAQIHSPRIRYLNTKGAFEIRKGNKFVGKTILLVDDVVTSGATAKEATKILKKHGAAKVCLLTLAKG